MIARVDHFAVSRLVAELFLGVGSGVDLAFLGDEEPRDALLWARIVAIDLVERTRVTTPGHADDHDVAVTIVAGASEAATDVSRGALAMVVSRVMGAMTHATRDGDGHHLALEHAEARTIPNAYARRGAQAASIIVRGVVHRSTGGSLVPIGDPMSPIAPTPP